MSTVHAAEDPFADLDQTRRMAVPETLEKPPPARAGGPLYLKREVLLQASRSTEEGGEVYLRPSLGAEVYKKLNTDHATVAAFDLQLRWVYRDQYLPVSNDAEGADREGGFLEYHNLYIDLYNAADPLLPQGSPLRAAGLLNVRLGRFYLPFGLNAFTDTHATLLQLSNERDLGFERDWQAGVYGVLNDHLAYNAAWLVGSGYDLSFDGQQGLFAGRLGLAPRYKNELGLEAGISALSGQRLSGHARMRSASVAERAGDAGEIDTERLGVDLRWQGASPMGSFSFTAEASLGRDERDDVNGQLCQVDLLSLDRTLGAGLQYRRFTQTFAASEAGSPGEGTDASVLVDLAWYFRNEIDSTRLHWVRLGWERGLESMHGPEDSVLTLQYYRYW